MKLTLTPLILICAIILGFAGVSQAALQGSIRVGKYSPDSYSKLALLSLEEAIMASQKVAPGKVMSSALENERGYLVYSVFVDNGKNLLEVIVDAGTGRVLEIAKEDRKVVSSSTEKQVFEVPDSVIY